ncbi:MAG: serine hydrolase domain-containing protein, partial [Verrucomicrobiota bacterium]
MWLIRRAGLILFLATVSARGEKTPFEEFIKPLIPDDPTIGVVAGMIESGTTNVYTYGKPTFDASTQFEIGSISKVFTGLALAIAVHEKKIDVDKPITQALPEGTLSKPTQITPKRLATHR